jgi:hypothetical protein
MPRQVEELTAAISPASLPPFELTSWEKEKLAATARRAERRPRQATVSPPRPRRQTQPQAAVAATAATGGGPPPQRRSRAKSAPKRPEERGAPSAPGVSILEPVHID